MTDSKWIDKELSDACLVRLPRRPEMGKAHKGPKPPKGEASKGYGKERQRPEMGKDHKGSAATAVKRIAKEGRKYGVGLMLVSQRPSEIDSTILSQCGTLFALPWRVRRILSRPRNSPWRISMG